MPAVHGTESVFGPAASVQAINLTVRDIRAGVLESLTPQCTNTYVTEFHVFAGVTFSAAYFPVVFPGRVEVV